MISTRTEAGGKIKRQITQEEKVHFWQEHVQGWRGEHYPFVTA